MRSSPVYYGWLVLAASAVCEMLIQGATSYSAGLFVLPLQGEFHISRANASSSVLILLFGAMLVSPLAGRILDRWPIRLVTLVGAVLLAVCFAGIALSASLWAMALFLLVPGSLAFMTVGPLNTSTLVSRWFHRHRGMALGFAAVATSGGGFAVVPFLSAAIAAHGWRTALLYEGLIIAAVIIVLGMLVLRDRPASLGLEGHPENEGAAQGVADALPLPAREVLASRAFWIPALTIGAVAGTSQVAVVTLPAYGVQLGFTLAQAAFLVSAYSIAAAITKIGSGILADRLNRRWLLVAAALAMTLSWSLLSVSASHAAVVTSAALAGFAQGCALPTVGALLAASFGPLRFGRVMGYAYTLTLFLALAGVRFAGFMYDRFAGYGYAFIGFAILLGAILLLTLMVAPSRTQAA